MHGRGKNVSKIPRKRGPHGVLCSSIKQWHGRTASFMASPAWFGNMQGARLDGAGLQGHAR